MKAELTLYREYHAEEYPLTVEVWETPEGICARVLEDAALPSTAMILHVKDEDPELNEREMELAKNALWDARTLPTIPKPNFGQPNP